MSGDAFLHDWLIDLPHLPMSVKAAYIAETQRAVEPSATLSRYRATFTVNHAT